MIHVLTCRIHMVLPIMFAGAPGVVHDQYSIQYEQYVSEN